MEFRMESAALDYTVGGIPVAGALFVAYLSGPVYGGISAGIPSAALLAQVVEMSSTSA